MAMSSKRACIFYLCSIGFQRNAFESVVLFAICISLNTYEPRFNFFNAFLNPSSLIPNVLIQILSNLLLSNRCVIFTCELTSTHRCTKTRSSYSILNTSFKVFSLFISHSESFWVLKVSGFIWNDYTFEYESFPWVHLPSPGKPLRKAKGSCFSCTFEFIDRPDTLLKVTTHGLLGTLRRTQCYLLAWSPIFRNCAFLLWIPVCIKISDGNVVNYLDVEIYIIHFIICLLTSYEQSKNHHSPSHKKWYSY